MAAQVAVDTDHLADKLPHLHAWNFVLGWLFWAVLHARDASGVDRAVLTVCCVPLMLVMFLGLGVPGAEMRVWVAIPATVLLIWIPVLRLPRPLAQPVLLIGQAVLFIFFLHYPFLLAVRTLLGGHLQPLALQGLQFAAGMAGPVLLWAVVTAAQRTLAHARMRRGKTGGRAGRARSGGVSVALVALWHGRSDAAPCLATDRRWALLDGWHLRLSPQDVLQDPVDRRFHPL